MARLGDVRALSRGGIAHRMRAGMSYDEAVSTPSTRPPRRFVPRASSMAVVRLGTVRKAIADVKKVLAKRPSDVKAKARLARIEGELAFLESLFEPR